MNSLEQNVTKRSASKANAGLKPSMKANHSICKIPENERRKLIAISAYLLAQKRGFVPGHEVEDWLAAEEAIDHCIF